jgi:hypothetical protein
MTWTRRKAKNTNSYQKWRREEYFLWVRILSRFPKMSLSGQTMELIVSLPVQNLGVSASFWMANNVIPFKNTRKRQLVHKKIVWTHCKPVPIFFRYMLVASRFISRSVGSSQLRGNLILERDWVAIQILFAPMNKERNKRLLFLIVHTDQSNVTFFPNRKVPQIYKSKRQLRVSVYTVGSKTCLPTHT